MDRPQSCPSAPQPDWVPVAVRSPEHGQTVLAFGRYRTGNTLMITDTYFGEWGRDGYLGTLALMHGLEVTHWAEKPMEPATQ